MTQEKETLLPCPFCGSSDLKRGVRDEPGHGGGWPYPYIQCNGCGARVEDHAPGNWSQKPEETWNRRASQ